MMTVLLCAGLGMVLGACQMRDPYVAAPATATSGNWKIERQVDRVTGVPVPSATNINNASNTFAERPSLASFS